MDVNNQQMEIPASLVPLTAIPLNSEEVVTTDHITSFEVSTEYKAPNKPGSVVYVKPPPKIAPKPANHVQNVPFNKSQTVFLKNSTTPLKANNIAYITMLKPQESVQVSTPQTFVLNHPQNRVAVTHTTNTVIPKFTLMPITLPNNNSQNVPTAQQNKLINVTISDSQIQSTENNSTIRIMQTTEPSLICDEILTDNDTNQLSYQLSISEETGKPHGVSILKKSNPQDLVKPYKSLYKTITTISDATTKEVKISTDFSEPISIDQHLPPVKDPDPKRQNTMPAIPKKEKSPPVQRSERRRKSTVLIRKDFSENDDPMDMILDDIMDTDDPNLNHKGPSEESVVANRTEFAEFNVNMTEDYDIIKGLIWDEGVGSLPGTNLKFQLNEFGILEYLTNAEYRKIYTKKLQRERLHQLTTSLQEGGEEMRCLECGCYGMPADFISPKYCSFDCQKAGDKKSSLLRQLATANYFTGLPQTLADININNNTISNTNQHQQQQLVNNNGNSNNYIKSYKKLENDAAHHQGNNNEVINNSSHSHPTLPPFKYDGRRKRKMIYIVDPLPEIIQTGSANGTDGSRSDEDADNGRDSIQYPWSCTKKGRTCFSWSKYLSHTNSKAVPVRNFKDPFPYQRNGFRLGMKLEGIDPQHPGTFCVLSVSEVRGYRIRVHLDGYSDQYDYWLNADSLDIFPAGYCEKHGYTLRSPPPYTEETFSWTAYLKDTKCTAAYKQIMANRPPFLPTNFRVGQKLEAVDRKNSNFICVASVASVMDNRILVHFDSWDDIYDYWADPCSPYIHPVGWSDQNGHNLTPPNDYPDPETFSWDVYLRDTKSQAAPVRAFKQRPASGFKRNMKLESVDKRVPQFIRVATVDDIDEHKIKIRFDGWPGKYSYWVDDDSPDIHPVSWCSKTGHPIEPPLTPDDVYDFLECPTVGCRGVGSTLGPAHLEHSTSVHCPYADENLDAAERWRHLPDRLLSPNRRPERAVVVSRGPHRRAKEPKRLGRPPKKQPPAPPSTTPPPYLTLKTEPPETTSISTGENISNLLIKDELPSSFPSLSHKKSRKNSTSTPPKKSTPILTSHGIDYADVHNVLLQIEQSKEETKLERKYTRKLDDLVESRCRMNPTKWSFVDVMNFVAGIPFCASKRQEFAKHNIDGKCFLMLTQKDLVELLDFKLGPAVKLYNCILLLRKRFPNCT